MTNPEYVCQHCRKICTTKGLLSLHYKATFHHAEEHEPVKDEVKENDTDGMNDGPCLIKDPHVFLEEPFEIIYE